VGGSAQIKAMRQVAGTLKLELAQYRELAAFAQFGSDLDKATQNQLNRGKRLVEILKQDQYQPLPMEKQVVIIFAATNGYLDRYPVSECRRYEKELYAFLDARYAALLKELAEKKDLKGEPTEKLKAALAEFAEVFQVRTEEPEAPPAKTEAPAAKPPVPPAH